MKPARAKINRENAVARHLAKHYPGVAVIDIGSNSIKLLVTARAEDHGLLELFQRTLDERISAGISRTRPRLSQKGMTRGLGAIRTLLADAASYQPARTILVATSAVRDAHNGRVFCERVHAATGHSIRLLSGDEEAALIGRGLTCDPALRRIREFYLFDLGGGSLECLSFRDRKVSSAISLQLGCVRLTERFVANPAGPILATELEAIARHTRATVTASKFSFSLPGSAIAVGTGGTITTLRAILAARAGCQLGTIDPHIMTGTFRRLRDELAALPLEQRRHVPGLPAERADVFPAALATLVAVAELGGLSAYRHSLYNLRFGLADEALD